MKKVLVTDLKNNSILARPVINTNGMILLYEGAELTLSHISKLKENNITEVYIEDEADKDKRTDMYSLETVEKDSIEDIKNTIQNRIRNDKEENMRLIEETAVKIINQVVENPEITKCLLSVKRTRSDIYEHMLNVASLSVIMGIKLCLNEIQLKNIAIGALMHDIGLCNLKMEYENIEIDKLPAVDKLNYRKHVIQGYEFLQQFDWMNETTKLIVLSHHERIDGSGYPFHKLGERIPYEVKLVSICDHFDELANGIGYKRRKIYEVVEFFRTNGAYLFDYDILSKVIVNIAWFPTGSLVVTNEGETGKIISQNRGLPDRPVIKIVKNADGTPCDKDIVKDLTDNLTVFIVDTVEE